MTDDQPDSHDEGPAADQPIRWWRPGWQDVAARMPYAWVLLAAAVLIVAVPVAVGLLLAGWTFIAASFKALAFLVGAALCLVGYVVRKAIQARREPFCIFCGYSLNGLPDHYRCPECGRPYTWDQIEQYRQDPQWFIDRWKARQALPPADRPVDAGPARPRRRSRDGTE